MHDYRLNEVLGKKIYHFIAPESREYIKQVLELTGWDERKASLLLKIPYHRFNESCGKAPLKDLTQKKTSNHQ